MRRLAAPVLLLCSALLMMAPAAAFSGAPVPPTPDPTATTVAPAVPGDGSTTVTLSPSAPLVPIPEGCPEPPVASVVFVGRVVDKDSRVARFQVIQVRAGSIAGYQVGNLVDVRYGNDVEYLDPDAQYLVGAVPQGLDLALTSTVREAKPLLGGNAVVGLIEKSSECPTIEDPVRTFHVDGTPLEASMLEGLSNEKDQIAMAFAKPVLAVFAIILALALVRWLFTAVFVAGRRAAQNHPASVGHRE